MDKEINLNSRVDRRNKSKYFNQRTKKFERVKDNDKEIRGKHE